MTRKSNACGHPNAAVERVPLLSPFEGKIEILPRIPLQHFVHRRAVEAKLGKAEETVGIDPRIWSTDSAFDFSAEVDRILRYLLTAQESTS